MLTQQMEEDVRRRGHLLTLHCRDSRESVILNANTPKTLPEKKKQSDRDLIQGLEGFDEDLDSTEYHDANDNTEEPIRKEETDVDAQTRRVSKGVMVVHL